MFSETLRLHYCASLDADARRDSLLSQQLSVSPLYTASMDSPRQRGTFRSERPGRQLPELDASYSYSSACSTPISVPCSRARGGEAHMDILHLVSPTDNEGEFDGGWGSMGKGSAHSTASTIDHLRDLEERLFQNNDAAAGLVKELRHQEEAKEALFRECCCLRLRQDDDCEVFDMELPPPPVFMQQRLLRPLKLAGRSLTC